MSDLWFYGRGSDISGPVTMPELTGLVAGGGVLATDTVWRDGVEDGVPAAQVPELFPTAAPAQMAGTRAAPAKNARATAGRGVLLMGQDGKTVKFKGKCTTCGHEDSSWKTMAIPRGTTRIGFFCSKCKKRRDGEIHGYH